MAAQGLCSVLINALEAMEGEVAGVLAEGDRHLFGNRINISKREPPRVLCQSSGNTWVEISEAI